MEFTLAIMGPDLLSFQMRKSKLSGKSRTVTSWGWGWGSDLQFMPTHSPQRDPTEIYKVTALLGTRRGFGLLHSMQALGPGQLKAVPRAAGPTLSYCHLAELGGDGCTCPVVHMNAVTPCPLSNAGERGRACPLLWPSGLLTATALLSSPA